MEHERKQSPWVYLAAATSILAAWAFGLLLLQLTRPVPTCEGPTIGAARYWQFEAEKFALLTVALSIAAGASCLYARLGAARRVRSALLVAVLLLTAVLAFSAFLAYLGWTPCLNT